ncbi:MAG: histidinol-phosphate transaminase [Gammaproteobacteria bacterium]|nr:MAG: histidinol-phosphate transaminase [Gammaproteobacteria bacterium]
MPNQPRSILRPEVLQMQAYHVPDASGYIKLDAMENPWPWPDELKSAWCEALREVEINRYPDPSARELTAALAAHMGLPDSMGLLLGNGSDELIQIIEMAVAKPGAVVMAPTPTFVMYEVIADWLGVTFVGVPLGEGFALDVAAMKTAMAKHDPAVVFLAWPNNPTANLYPKADVRAIIEAAPGLVVVDEAYQPFAQDTLLPALTDYDNLLVMRTLSKAGFAGLRLGMLAGHSRWLEEFDKLRLPYNINSLTQASARFALSHWDVFGKQVAILRTEREKMLNLLQNTPGVTVWPSKANFIIFRVADAPAVHAALKQRKILIKSLHQPDSPLENCLRVTVGRPEENQSFITALTRIFHEDAR